MKKLLSYKLFLLVLFLPVRLFAQDITGLWQGEMYVDSTKQYLPYEISISEVKGKLIGYSLITFEENGKKETGLRDITIERKDDKIVIEDVSLIENSFSFVPPKNIKKTMIVFLTIGDTIMQLSGYWSTNRTKHYLSATGSVELHRKNDYRATVLYKKLEVLKLADKVVFKEPEKKPEVVTAMVITSTPPVAVVSKPVEEKKTTSTMVKEAPPTPPAVVVTKPAEVKTQTPPIVKPAISKPIAPTVAVVARPIEVKKAAPVVAKPAPPPVVAAPVIVAKPKETVAVVEKKPEPVKLPAVATGAVDVNKRAIATTQSVFYKSDSLVLTLYDNGYVDGDTVSVVMNGDVIFSKQGLSTKAVSKTIYITKETPDSIRLVMYAENLGSIPPNTGLLVVHDGEAVYDVRFSADLKSNAAIILTRKKTE